MFKQLTSGYDDLWQAIIRPPRDSNYTVEDLGPAQFKTQGVAVQRKDFQIKNKKNQNLECSFFCPIKRPCPQLPCVIYLHGNSSSRLEALPILDVLLPQYIQVLCFDFSGSGKSDGEYISLGWYERDDVECIVNWLRESNQASTIGLWGRSMGAVTALMHADRDPSIAGLVLDSPFSSLKILAEELATQYANKMPKFVLSGAMSMIRKTVQSKANFDLELIDPLKNHVSKAFIPAFFIAGDEDTFIVPQHTKKLHEAYAGDKNISIVPGDHNSRRPSYVMNSISIFFYNTLQVKYLVPEYNNVEDDGGNYQEHIPKNIGNQHQVIGALGAYDEDEELRKAIEASLQLNDKPINNNNQQPPQPPAKKDLLEFSDDEGLL